MRVQVDAIAVIPDGRTRVIQPSTITPMRNDGAPLAVHPAFEGWSYLLIVIAGERAPETSVSVIWKS